MDKTKTNMLIKVDKVIYDKFVKVCDYLSAKDALKKISRMKVASEILERGLEGFINKSR